MKIIKHCMLALALMAAMPSWAQTDEGVTRYVNPFIGTGQVDAHSLKGGNFPGATTPFGTVEANRIISHGGALVVVAEGGGVEVFALQTGDGLYRWLHHHVEQVYTAGAAQMAG